MKAIFNFSPAEKDGMLQILGKYDQAPDHHSEIANDLHVDGSTVLWPEDALYLAGIIVHYYVFLTQRILDHPAVKSYLAEEA